jgi:hypothetical protein
MKRLIRGSMAWASLISCLSLTPIVPAIGQAGGTRPTAKPSVRSSAGVWRIQSSRDELTDSVRFSIYVDAAQPIQVRYRTITPRLAIQCRSGELNIAFYIGGPSNDEEMQLRFDEGEVLTLSSMDKSTNLEWLYVSDYEEPNVRHVLARLSDARRVRARFTPFVESPVTFSFDVRGLKAVLPRLERAGCRTSSPISTERTDTSTNGNAGGETAVTGDDVGTTRSDEGAFSFPGYRNNVVRQLALNFKPSTPGAGLQAEVRFLIHRDGSVSDIMFIRRSGNFSFDLEAQRAVEAASSSRGFGPLPGGYTDDVLPVVYSFGTGADTDSASDQKTYFEFQVEKPAEIVYDSPRPKYPSVLESSGLAGEVQAQFVVTSSGNVNMDTFKVLKSTNELFTQAVKNVLPRMQFSPATIGEKAVSQLVQRSFNFRVGDQVPEGERSYPPTARDLFIPPVPAPQAVKGFHMKAIFDVDEKGNSKLVSFTQTSDVAYNKRVEEVLRAMRFRPGVRADGTPQRDTATIEIVF